jgi:hypothetical protein
MVRKLLICVPFCLITVLVSVPHLHAQKRTAETVRFCQLISHLDKYSANPVTLRVRVRVYRHGTSISDPACPKHSLTLIADQTAFQSNSLSHFYQFLAQHRRTSKPIYATITGRLIDGDGGEFVLGRRVIFKLESVSEVSEGS